jgi:hypothetical protein
MGAKRLDSQYCEKNTFLGNPVNAPVGIEQLQRLHLRKRRSVMGNSICLFSRCSRSRALAISVFPHGLFMLLSERMSSSLSCSRSGGEMS